MSRNSLLIFQPKLTIGALSFSSRLMASLHFHLRRMLSFTSLLFSYSLSNLSENPNYFFKTHIENIFTIRLLLTSCTAVFQVSATDAACQDGGSRLPAGLPVPAFDPPSSILSTAAREILFILKSGHVSLLLRTFRFFYISTKTQNPHY